MINIDKIFERGYVEQNLLKQILKSLQDEINNLKNASTPYFKFNETINIEESKKLDDMFKEYIELTYEPKNKNNFIILGEYIDTRDFSTKIDFISPVYIEDIKLNKIFFKSDLELSKYQSLYITYQY
ncbi:MAG: hypothetical protein ACRCW9_10085 [Cetobacterium sp.]